MSGPVNGPGALDAVLAMHPGFLAVVIVIGAGAVLAACELAGAWLGDVLDRFVGPLTRGGRGRG